MLAVVSLSLLPWIGPLSLAALLAWLLGATILLASLVAADVRSKQKILRTSAANWSIVVLPVILTTAPIYGAYREGSFFSLETVRALGILTVLGFFVWILALAIGSLVAKVRRRTDLAPRSQWDLKVRTRSALLVILVPLGASLAASLVNEAGISRCKEMERELQEGGLGQDIASVMAKACRSRGRSSQAEVSGLTLISYSGSEDVITSPIASRAAEVAAHFSSILGPPDAKTIGIYPADLSQDIRGTVGHGFLLINTPELKTEDCADYLASAGTDDHCGAWVLAHEVAHQWLPLSSAAWPSSEVVVYESAADYLAFDWWRTHFGEQAAETVFEELFVGRLRLKPFLVSTTPPANSPIYMSTDEQRALIYGRGSGGWIWADRTLGRERTLQALKAMYLAAHSYGLDARTGVASVREADQEVAAILEQWWLETDFVPTPLEAKHD